MNFYIEAVHGEWDLINKMLDEKFDAHLEVRGFTLTRVIKIDTIEGFVTLNDQLKELYEFSDSAYHGIVLENDRHRENKYPTLMIYDGYME
ncbi:MAG: hypothetical protein JSU04_00235 [Bdellovibrionales bacterium]|nr:hypothetical protein [Bdellovibrionales bacterium]